MVTLTRNVYAATLVATVIKKTGFMPVFLRLQFAKQLLIKAGAVRMHAH